MGGVTPFRTRKSTVIALAVLGALLSLHALEYSIVVEDSYIAFRYSENLASGHGLVFNPGERVEGYTSFLWVLLLSGAARLGLDIAKSSQVLGAISGLAALLVTYYCARQAVRLPRWESLIACAVLVSSSCTAMWIGAGMETPLYTALVTLAIGLLISDARGRPAFPLSGVVFGLATLTRPEAGGIFIICFACCLILSMRHPRFLAKVILGFLLVVLPHLVFRLLYYGDPLPNTFYAKTAANIDLLRQGVDYSVDFFVCHGPWALLALAGLRWQRSSESAWQSWVLPLVALGTATAYVTSVGGDFYSHFRFYVPYIPWVTLMVMLGASHLAERARRSHLPALRTAAVGLTLIVGASMALPAKFCPEQQFQAYQEKYLRNAELLTRVGLWLKDNRPSTDLMALCAIGRIPYYSGLATIDMLGLTDKHIARTATDSSNLRIGHHQYDGGYVLSREPDIVVLEFGRPRLEFEDKSGLYTEKLYQAFLESEGWFPAYADLLERQEFRLHYSPRIADTGPGLVFYYFERDTALEEMAARVAPDSIDPKAHFDLGMLYRKQGLIDEAVDSMRRSTALNPIPVDPHLNVGYFYYEARRYEEAESEFQNLIQKMPAEPRAWYGLAISLHRQGHFERAIPNWTRFLELDPNGAFSTQARGMLAEAFRMTSPSQETP